MDIDRVSVDEIVEARGGDYGHPYDNFSLVAAFWNYYAGARGQGALYALTAEDVGMMMILLKVARGATGEITVDTIDDIAGYAKCIQLIREKESE